MQPCVHEINESRHACITCWYCTWKFQRSACWNTQVAVKDYWAGADSWQSESQRQLAEKRHCCSRFLPRLSRVTCGLRRMTSR